MHKLGIFLGILLILSLLVASCSSNPTTPAASSPPPSSTTASPSTTTPASESGPQYGGILKIIEIGNVTNMGHPGYLDTPTDWGYARPALETLVALDEEGNYYYRLATSYEISDDGKAITFKLREGVKYHDGTDFNAQSVKECLDIARTGEISNLRAIESIDVVDEYTVRLNLPKMDWGVLSSLATGKVGQMMSPTFLKSVPKEKAFVQPVGTGPFKFVSYEQNVSVKYERFEDYWGEKPYLDGVEYIIHANPTTALMSFKAGDAHVLCQPAAKDFDDLKNSGYNVYPGMPGPVCIYFDNANENSPFADIRVRQAFCYAIDNDALADSLGYGYYEGAVGLYSKNHYLYNPDIKGYPYNPDKARQLLKEAGYENGFKTQLTMVSGRSQDLQITMQDYLRQVGIDMSINAVTLPKFSEMSGKGWEGVMTGLGPRPLDDPCQAMRNGYISLGSVFVSAGRIPEIEELYLKACSELNLETKKAQLLELCRMIVDDYCQNYCVYFSPSADNTSAWVPELQDANLGLQWWTLEKAWLKK